MQELLEQIVRRAAIRGGGIGAKAPKRGLEKTHHRSCTLTESVDSGIIFSAHPFFLHTFEERWADLH
jgi:hypothetical protein